MIVTIILKIYQKTGTIMQWLTNRTKSHSACSTLCSCLTFSLLRWRVKTVSVFSIVLWKQNNLIVKLQSAQVTTSWTKYTHSLCKLCTDLYTHIIHYTLMHAIHTVHKYRIRTYAKLHAILKMEQTSTYPWMCTCTYVLEARMYVRFTHSIILFICSFSPSKIFWLRFRSTSLR